MLHFGFLNFLSNNYNINASGESEKGKLQKQSVLRSVNPHNVFFLLACARGYKFSLSQMCKCAESYLMLSTFFSL